MIVANPIYDIVFKYLMEDERIARTILSALLKKEVLSIEMRRNEYSDQHRDNLSIFRIDFGATVREADGTERLILIEVQKTWVENETLRFRQYLGAQYGNKCNVVGLGREEHALPMVAVYLLGHKVGDIEEPVIYVNHSVRDYYDHPVERGIPDPFVESLTHNSIIVQIPRLSGRIRNHLDKVLSIFDQRNANPKNTQTLALDTTLYDSDPEMQPILRRLLEAAADPEMRHKMDVEDEFFSVLERRDTDIMVLDKKLAEEKAALKQAKAETEQAKAETEQARAETEQAKAETEQARAETEQARAEKDMMLRNIVRSLFDKGLSTEEICRAVGMDETQIMRWCNER